MALIQAGALIAGRYLLADRLDVGGRAQVWSATDNELKRPVGVKILLTPTGGDPAFVEVFRTEAQLEAKLAHPGIVEVFDWGHDGDVNFVVMELLAGETVTSLLANGLFASDRVINAGRQIASALVYSHAEGVSHGSVGPDHTIVGPDGRATLIDFGLQCRGQYEYPPVPDSDTFALGALLYQMLTGVSPTGPRPANLGENDPWPEHPHKMVPGVPSELDRVVMKAISPEPAERYQTAAELQAALDELVRPKRRVWLWVTLAVLAVLLAVAGTWFFTSQMKIVVPDVTGKPSAVAQSVLASASLKMVVTGETPSSSVATGSIVSEIPAAGAKVRRGSQVGVTLSSGKPMVTVPAVTGVDLQTASSQIAGAGLVVGTVTKQASATFPVDTVVSSSPAAGVSINAGAAVGLIVSAGQAQATVPDVRGKSQADATVKLQGLGLAVEVGTTYSSQPNGIVVSQGPAAGTTVVVGSTVTISVSKGPAPVAVPDVTGAQEADAKTSLRDLGLVPVSVPTSGSAGQLGTVISQQPDAGSKVAPGSQVRIFVGK